MSVALKKNREPRATDKAMTVHVAESGTRTPKGTLRCELDRNISFSTRSLESYFFAAWDAAAYDALLVAAAVEFADKAQKRRAHYWPREFHLSVPVHDVARWSGARVHERPARRAELSDRRQMGDRVLSAPAFGSTFRNRDS